MKYCFLLLAVLASVVVANDDSCIYNNDHECDEDNIPMQYCAHGTDTTDCLEFEEAWRIRDSQQISHLSIVSPSCLDPAATSELFASPGSSCEDLGSTTLAKDIEHSDAVFGLPQFQGKLQGQLFYGTPADVMDPTIDRVVSTACDPIDEDWVAPWLLHKESTGQSVILMLDGSPNCTYVTQMRNAQRKGVDAVIIADRGESDQATRLPLMGDDGTGDDVHIPGLMVRSWDAQLLRDAVAAGLEPQVLLHWDLVRPDNTAEVTLWLSSDESEAIDFLAGFESALLALGPAAVFTPKYAVLDGTMSGCVHPSEPCGHQCTHGGRYCSTDPDEEIGRGYSGAEVVQENLRQICIWRETVVSETEQECVAPSTEELDWAELSAAEKAGAEILGWEEFSWDCFGDEAESESGTEEEDGPGIVEGEEEEGSNDNNDDNGDGDSDGDGGDNSCSSHPPPASESKAWSELDGAERVGAQALGYGGARSWDRDDMVNSCLHPHHPYFQYLRELRNRCPLWWYESGAEWEGGVETDPGAIIFNGASASVVLTETNEILLAEDDFSLLNEGEAVVYDKGSGGTSVPPLETGETYYIVKSGAAWDGGDSDVTEDEINDEPKIRLTLSPPPGELVVVDLGDGGSSLGLGSRHTLTPVISRASVNSCPGWDCTVENQVCNLLVNSVNGQVNESWVCCPGDSGSCTDDSTEDSNYCWHQGQRCAGREVENGEQQAMTGETCSVLSQNLAGFSQEQIADIERCVVRSDREDGSNALLDAAIAAQTESGVALSLLVEESVFLVNALRLDGQLDCPLPISPNTCGALAMICGSLKEPNSLPGHPCSPDYCWEVVDDCGKCRSGRSDPDWNSTCCEGRPGMVLDVCNVCGGTGSIDSCQNCKQADDPSRQDGNVFFCSSLSTTQAGEGDLHGTHLMWILVLTGSCLFGSFLTCLTVQRHLEQQRLEMNRAAKAHVERVKRAAMTYSRVHGNAAYVLPEAPTEPAELRLGIFGELWQFFGGSGPEDTGTGTTSNRWRRSLGNEVGNANRGQGRYANDVESKFELPSRSRRHHVSPRQSRTSTNRSDDYNDSSDHDAGQQNGQQGGTVVENPLRRIGAGMGPFGSRCDLDVGQMGDDEVPMAMEVIDEDQPAGGKVEAKEVDAPKGVVVEVNVPTPEDEEPRGANTVVIHQPL